jgi:hypothetical protein
MGRVQTEPSLVQLKTKAGLALVALGIAILGIWSWWSKTRNFIPVSIPVSWFSGQSLTSQFKLNFDGLYLIELDAEKSLPPDILHCLMGGDPDPMLCKDTPPSVAATWILTRGGQEIARGSSAELHSAPLESETVARVIGEFRGQSGQMYDLQVKFTSDGASLAAAHPRLKVAVASIAYSDLQSAGVLVFSIAFICLLFGLILLAITDCAKQRNNPA